MIENRAGQITYEDTNETEWFRLRKEPVLDIFRGSGFGETREYIGSFNRGICLNLYRFRELLRRHDPEKMNFCIYWDQFFNRDVT